MGVCVRPLLCCIVCEVKVQLSSLFNFGGLLKTSHFIIIIFFFSFTLKFIFKNNNI